MGDKLKELAKRAWRYIWEEHIKLLLHTAIVLGPLCLAIYAGAWIWDKALPWWTNLDPVIKAIGVFSVAFFAFALLLHIWERIRGEEPGPPKKS